MNIDAANDVQQFVDGNGFLLVRIHQAGGSSPARAVLEEVRRSRRPPVFVFDGAGANERRRAVYPAYKMNRKPHGEDVFATVRLIRECLEHLCCVQIEVPGWEADDVLATLAAQRALNSAVRPWFLTRKPSAFLCCTSVRPTWLIFSTERS